MIKQNLPYRVERKVLSEVCMDCCDFIKTTRACDDCAVYDLKERFREISIIKRKNK